MGHHFVPQRYLKGFEDPKRPGFVWLHDRLNGEAARVPIEKALQSRGFYPPETEGLLAQRVEIPGNAAIAAVLAGESIDLEQKVRLGYYIAVMMGRVPASRKTVDRLLPEQLDGAVARTRLRLMAAAALGDVPPDDLQSKLDELEDVKARYGVQLPADLYQEAYEPWPSQDVVEHISGMHWRVLTTLGPVHFVTTDNPVFFFTGLGLAHPEVELCFPLASGCALHASWQPVQGTVEYVVATQQIVKEFNRRLCSTAQRIVVYHEDAPWLHELLAEDDASTHA